MLGILRTGPVLRYGIIIEAGVACVVPERY